MHKTSNFFIHFTLRIHLRLNGFLDYSNLNKAVNLYFDTGWAFVVLVWWFHWTHHDMKHWFEFIFATHPNPSHIFVRSYLAIPFVYYALFWFFYLSTGWYWMYQAKNVPNCVCVVQVVTMQFFAIINSAFYFVFTEKKTCNIHNEQNIRAENKHRQNSMVSGMQHYFLYYLVPYDKMSKKCHHCTTSNTIVDRTCSIERARDEC